jgi:uncharacterized damage-inducible protein DinB
MQVADLVRYNHIVRGIYLDALKKLPWAEVTKGRGLSFDCIRNVFLHLTMVEDRWISYIIPGKYSSWQTPNFDAYADVASLERYTNQVKTNTETYLANLTVEELARQITLPWSDQPNMQVTIEKCLAHMVLEDMIHYGELSAALWQMGLEAPYMGFWRYGISEPVSRSFEPPAPK